jgi:uncharacterized protein YjbJ (UPF0337 family)
MRQGDFFAEQSVAPAVSSAPQLFSKETQMDKDRINGAADQAKGAIKEAAGKVTGDTKLKVEGAVDKATGKVESAVGKARDDVRDEASKS